MAPNSTLRAVPGRAVAMYAVIVLGASAGCGDGPASPPPAGNGVTLVIAPGALLFAEAGATQQLRAYALDSDGDSTPVAASFQSSDPGVVTIADDVAAGGASLGAARIVATAGELTSAPILALRATAAPGALLVTDSQVIGPIEAVDAGAPYGPGWQYRFRLRGNAPSVGQILIGVGGTPIGGRVVSSSGETDAAVVLELLPLHQLLPDLTFRQRLPMQPAMPIGSSAHRGHRSSISGTASPADFESEFARGPFRCTAVAAAPFQFPLTLDAFSYEAHADLDYEVEFANSSLRRAIVQGTLGPRVSANPLITATLDGKATCKVQFREFPLPVGGVIALVVGGQVPVGLGFQIRARADFGQIGFDAFLDATVTTSFGVDCTDECTVGGSIALPSYDGYFKPRLPNLDTASRFELSASAFVYGELKLGSPLSENWQFKAAEVRGGLEQSMELASREVQAADPEYASRYALRPLLEAKAESTLTTLGNVLSINLSELHFTPTLPELARSPRGTLTIAPASVAPGSETALGERATFSVALTDVNYLGAYAVEGVEIRWRKQNGAEVSLEPGRPGCTDLEAAQDQVTFACETDFLEEHAGEQAFHAFLRTRIWGVPVPVALEVAPNGAATLVVSDTDAPGKVELVEEPSPGSGARVSYQNAVSPPDCDDDEPPDDAALLPALATSAHCSTHATSNEGAALSGEAGTEMTYAFDLDGDVLRSFTATAHARAVARGEGVVPGNLAAGAGRANSHANSGLSFEFEVTDVEAEIALTGQLTHSISRPDGNIGALARVQIRRSGTDVYVASAGREFPMDETRPNASIGTTLRLPRGVYDFSVEIVAYGNTYVDYPDLQGESGFTITMTVAP